LSASSVSVTSPVGSIGIHTRRLPGATSLVVNVGGNDRDGGCPVRTRPRRVCVSWSSRSPLPRSLRGDATRRANAVRAAWAKRLEPRVWLDVSRPAVSHDPGPRPRDERSPCGRPPRTGSSSGTPPAWACSRGTRCVLLLRGGL
jgi:hypothetical protein